MGGKGDAKNRVVLYNCTSGYPVPFESVCLLDIRLLQEKYQHRVKHIGFSGHHLGIAIDVAAYAMGATWIERHFTKDRTWKGTDHAAHGRLRWSSRCEDQHQYLVGGQTVRQLILNATCGCR